MRKHSRVYSFFDEVAYDTTYNGLVLGREEGPDRQRLVRVSLFDDAVYKRVISGSRARNGATLARDARSRETPGKKTSRKARSRLSLSLSLRRRPHRQSHGLQARPPSPARTAGEFGERYLWVYLCISLGVYHWRSLRRNHGVIITGDSVAEAFDELYFFERGCPALNIRRRTTRGTYFPSGNPNWGFWMCDSPYSRAALHFRVSRTRARALSL